jgi:hypothetical protein
MASSSRLPSLLPTTNIPTALRAEASKLSSPTSAGGGQQPPPLLPALSAEVSVRESRLCDDKWRALLALYKLEKHTPWSSPAPAPSSSPSPRPAHFPPLRRFIHLADELAPSGLLPQPALEIVLSRVYSLQLARQWASSPHLSLAPGESGSLFSSTADAAAVNAAAGPGLRRSGPFGPVAPASPAARGAAASSSSPHPGGAGPKFSPIALPGTAAARTLQRTRADIEAEIAEDEQGAIFVGTDARTGLRSLGPPKPAGWASSVRMTDAAIVTYLSHRENDASPQAFIMAMQKDREQEALAANLKAKGGAHVSGLQGGAGKPPHPSGGTRGQGPPASPRDSNGDSSSGGGGGGGGAGATPRRRPVPSDPTRDPTHPLFNPFANPSRTPTSLWAAKDAASPSFLVEFAALWRDLWRGFSRPVLPPNPTPSSTAAPTPCLDVRLLAAAYKMLPFFRKATADPRFALAEAVRTVAFYAGDGKVSRRDLDLLLAVALRRTADRAVAEAAAAEAFVRSMTTPYHLGYAGPDDRLPLDVVLSRVLPHRALDVLLGAHPKSTPALPVTHYELLVARPLRDFIAKRKAKRAKILAARDLLARRLTRLALRALRDNARREKAWRTVVTRLTLLAREHDQGRAADAFAHWRAYSVRVRAVLRVQGFARMVVARADMRRQSARLYVAAQVGRLHRWRERVQRVRDQKLSKARAALSIQRVYRGLAAKKEARDRAAELEAALARGELTAAARSRLAAEEAERHWASMAVGYWLLRRRAARALLKAVTRLAQRARERAVLMAARAEIEWEVAEKREKRRLVDRALANAAAADKRVRLKRKMALAGGAKRAGGGSRGTAGGEPDGGPVGHGYGGEDDGGGRAAAAAAAAPPALVRLPSSHALASLGAGIPGAAVAPTTTTGVALLPTVAPDLWRTEAWAGRVLKRFFRVIAARARLRRALVGRVERRYDVTGNRYFYVDARDGHVWTRRPVMLGPRHELAVPDLWEALWDPRAPASPYFFNMRFHVVAWDQPPGTILCATCGRAFADVYCHGCRCGACVSCWGATHVAEAERGKAGGASAGSPGSRGDSRKGRRARAGRGGITATAESARDARVAALAAEAAAAAAAASGKIIGHATTRLRGGLENAQAAMLVIAAAGPAGVLVPEVAGEGGGGEGGGGALVASLTSTGVRAAVAMADEAYVPVASPDGAWFSGAGGTAEYPAGRGGAAVAASRASRGTAGR